MLFIAVQLQLSATGWCLQRTGSTVARKSCYGLQQCFETPKQPSLDESRSIKCCLARQTRSEEATFCYCGLSDSSRAAGVPRAGVNAFRTTDGQMTTAGMLVAKEKIYTGSQAGCDAVRHAKCKVHDVSVYISCRLSEACKALLADGRTSRDHTQHVEPHGLRKRPSG